MKEILAIIPARGGSKGLKDKNILPLVGHPLIAYSIKAAQASKLISRVIVSTDSEVIADVARQYNAEVPFIRPAEYAGDLSTDFEVFYHALTWLHEHENYRPDAVVQLRPTSPIRSAEIIDTCIEKLMASQADSLRIITPSPITPYKMWTATDEDSYMKPLLTLDNEEEPFNQPRQKLPATYWQIGFLDVIKTETILEKKSISGTNILPHIVENRYAVDIDDINSFQKAAEVLQSSTEYVQF